jgi:hypothetical protein
MWERLLHILRGRKAEYDRAVRQRRFFQRYSGRTLIVHAGLTIDWMEELLKVGGGGGHFRIDTRLPPTKPPTAIEWIVHEHVLPLGLPLPLLMQVSPGLVRIRHLQQHGVVRHPADIAWILDDMGDASAGGGRVHATLRVDGSALRVERGIPPEDNAVETPYGISL